MSRRRRRRPNLVHCRPYQVVDATIRQSNPSRIEPGDCADRIQARVVHQLPPSAVAHVGGVVTLGLSASGVDAHEILGCLLLDGRVEIGIAEWTEDNLVVVVVLNDAVGDLVRADHTDAREDGVLREALEQRPFDVEAILDEYDGCVSGCDRRRDEVGKGRRDVGDVLGGADDVVEGLNRVFLDVGDAVDNWIG